MYQTTVPWFSWAVEKASVLLKTIQKVTLRFWGYGGTLYSKPGTCLAYLPYPTSLLTTVPSFPSPCKHAPEAMLTMTFEFRWSMNNSHLYDLHIWLQIFEPMNISTCNDICIVNCKQWLYVGEYVSWSIESIQKLISICVWMLFHVISKGTT